MNEGIVLIGPRAAGKTTLGRRLAAHLGWEFVDADEVLEQRHDRSVAEWLAEDPEDFRAAEIALLPEILAREGAVVALGGGVVEEGTARARLSAHPHVIGLRAPLGELLERQRDGSRPPLTDLPLDQEVAVVWKRRFPRYHEACRGRWVDTAGSVEDAWKRLLATVTALQLPPRSRGGAAGSSSGS